MQLSPLQLKELLFRRVSIEPTDEALQDRSGAADQFDFSGVRLDVETAVGIAAGQEDDPKDFLVDLRIKLDADDHPRPPPYKLDVQAFAVIQASPKLARERREALVTVNGLAMIYGAIRELVASVTGRFPHGILTLPTVNFIDHEKAGETQSPEPALRVNIRQVQTRGKESKDARVKHGSEGKK